MGGEPGSTRWVLFRGKSGPFFRSPTTRSVAVIILVCLFFVYPWRVSGPVAYDASDPRLVYVSPGSAGGAFFDPVAKQVDVHANMTGGPRLDLVSSESSFVFSTDVEIIQQTGPPTGGWPSQSFDTPSALVLKLWHPRSAGEVWLGFRIVDEIHGTIFLEVLHNGWATYNHTIATYVVGQRFRITSVWNRLESVAFSVANDAGFSFSWSGNDTSKVLGVRDLASQTILALSVHPRGSGFISRSTLFESLYFFPGKGRFASFVGDGSPLMATFIILVAIVALQWQDGRRLAVWLLKRRVSRLGIVFKNHWEAWTVLCISGAAYVVVANSFGGLPFDSIVFKTWVYGAQLDGLQGLYGRTSSVGDTFIRPDQRPWSSLGFAYLPFAAYLMIVVSRFLPPLSTFESQLLMFQSSGLESQIKILLGSFALVAGGILYVIVLKDTGRKRRALTAMAFFLLNPAIVFDSMIWGETDTVLYVLFLGFAWLAARRAPWALAFLPLFLAFKQTGVILIYPAALLAFMPGWNVRDWLVTWSRMASVALLSAVPLLIGGILPSAFITPFVEKILDIGTPLGAFPPAVSPDTYTLWTTFTGFEGASGIGRLHYPATAQLAGLSVNFLGYLVFIPLLLSTFALLRPRARTADSSLWYAITAFAPIALTALLTGAAARYYTLAIPCLIVFSAVAWDRLRQVERIVAVSTTILVTSISLWTMAGIFTWIMKSDLQYIHGLDVSQNLFMAFVGGLYTNDTVITLGSLGAVIALAFSTYLMIATKKRHASGSGDGSKM